MKKLMALFTALALLLCLAVGASASVPSKPREFAYAYDYDGSVLSNSSMSVIANYGSALEDATGIQAIAVVVDFLDGQDPADYATESIRGASVRQAKTTALSFFSRAVTARFKSEQAGASTA